jgi:hypothetical protein
MHATVNRPGKTGRFIFLGEHAFPEGRAVEKGSTGALPAETQRPERLLLGEHFAGRKNARWAPGGDRQGACPTQNCIVAGGTPNGRLRVLKEEFCIRRRGDDRRAMLFEYCAGRLHGHGQEHRWPDRGVDVEF